MTSLSLTSSRAFVMAVAISLGMALATIGSSIAAQESPSADSNQARVIDIVGGSYFFRPDRISVRVNEPLELRVRKESGMVPHNFVIDAAAAGVRVDEPIDKTARTIRVTFTQSGEYTFYCSRKLLFFKSHRDRGMVGTIEVTP